MEGQKADGKSMWRTGRGLSPEEFLTFGNREGLLSSEGSRRKLFGKWERVYSAAKRSLFWEELTLRRCTITLRPSRTRRWKEGLSQYKKNLTGG